MPISESTSEPPPAPATESVTELNVLENAAQQHQQPHKRVKFTEQQPRQQRPRPMAQNHGELPTVLGRPPDICQWLRFYWLDWLTMAFLVVLTPVVGAN